MRDFDKCEGLVIENVWPVNTKYCPNGGIGIDWSGRAGFGQLVLTWESDGKLHADTEFMDSEQDKRFTEVLLKLLVNEIIIDE